MRLFSYWFNLPLTPGAEYITDENNIKYWIYWTNNLKISLHCRVYFRGKCISRIDSLWQKNDGLELAEIIIFENSYKLRHKGIGKAMINCFIKKAKSLGAKYIIGNIQSHEGSTDDYLVEWYKRQGFDIIEKICQRHIFFMRLCNER